MRFARSRAWTALLALVLVTAVTAGCAKKPVTTTTPPPAPVETPPTPPTTTPAPTPATTPQPAPSFSVADLRPVFFDYDSYALRDDARSTLDANARMLRENGDVRLTIEGHCDERGTVEYNQALGEKRAQAARDYLAAAGIAAGRLEVVSYGKERPFAMGSDEGSWQQNRRAHFVSRGQ